NIDEPVKSLDQGLESIEFEYFLIKALSSPFYVQNSEEEVWYNRFNQRSVITALACRFIGEEITCPDLEELYLYGLLHNIGILFLKSNFPEEYALVLEKANKGEKLAQVEREILTTDHIEVAERAFKDWSFPRNFQIALAGNKLSSEKGAWFNKHLVKVIDISEKLSEVLFVEAEKSKINQLFKTWEEDLNLTTGFFERLYSNLHEMVNQRSTYSKSISGNQMDMVLKVHQLVGKLCQSCENKLKDRFRELSIENEKERKKAELESLKIVLATFSHYINNATTSIMGRSQLIDIAIRKGEIKDESGKISSAMKIIQQGVENITAVLNGLKKLDSFRTVRYHERSNIIDLKDKIDIKSL
ncbi:MAG: HDOD domain-containing protein, partial [candidate division Zixibacteria bacterium]|nr:HDOD domain-containing protein [candidate division Zixibacteria bacterium]